MLCDTGTPVGPTTIFGHTFLHSSLRSSITSHVIFVAVAGHRPWPIDNIDVEELVSISELLALLCCCCCSSNIYDTAELTSVPSSSVIHMRMTSTWVEERNGHWTYGQSVLRNYRYLKSMWSCCGCVLSSGWLKYGIHEVPLQSTTLYLSLCLWPKHDHQTLLAIPPYSKLFKRSVSQTVEH